MLWDPDKPPAEYFVTDADLRPQWIMVALGFAVAGALVEIAGFLYANSTRSSDEFSPLALLFLLGPLLQLVAILLCLKSYYFLQAYYIFGKGAFTIRMDSLKKFPKPGPAVDRLESDEIQEIDVRSVAMVSARNRRLPKYIRVTYITYSEQRYRHYMPFRSFGKATPADQLQTYVEVLLRLREYLGPARIRDLAAFDEALAIVEAAVGDAEKMSAAPSAIES